MIRFKFVIWVIVTIAAILSASTQPRSFVHYVINLLLLMPFFALGHLFYSLKHLKVQLLSQQKTLLRNEIGNWQLIVTNSSSINTIRLIHLRESYILSPNTSFELNYPTPAQHVGYLYPNIDTKLKIVDLFGLFSKRIALPKASVAYVLPFTHSKHNTSFDGNLEEYKKQQISRPFSLEEEELDSIFPLDPSFPLRRIHWKLSARLQEWMVKRYYQTTNTILTIFLELDYFERLDYRDQYLDFIANLLTTTIKQEITTYLIAQNKKILIDNLEDSLLFLAKLEQESNHSLDRMLKEHINHRQLNLIVLSHANMSNYQTLLDYEKYFEQTQIIQFLKPTSTLEIPSVLAQIAIISLEYEDEAN